MGAWIETPAPGRVPEPLPSHPMWVRGLKQNANDSDFVSQVVAPYVGAWIETNTYHIEV